MCLLGWGGSQGGRGGRGRQAVYMTAFLGKGGWRVADGAGPGVPSAELSLGTGGHICPNDGRLALGSGVWKVRLSPRSSGRIAKNFKCLLLRQSHQGPKTGLQEFRGSERGQVPGLDAHDNLWTCLLVPRSGRGVPARGPVKALRLSSLAGRLGGHPVGAQPARRGSRLRR